MAAVLNPLLEVLREPARARDFSIADWGLLLRQARREKLVARMGVLLDDAGLLATCPLRIAETVRAARTLVDFHQIQIARELRQLAAALDGLDAALLLLKGAAYLASGLPLSRGRRMADVDILVPRHRLGAIEQRLLDRGWESHTLDSYDQRYYREWMHEIPPLRHPERGIEVDVHHNLLPLTCRVHPQPEILWRAARALPHGPFATLAPTDMVLHSAAHLFYDGEIRGGLRDLIDLAQLLAHFRSEAGFWRDLPDRAERLELVRPLYYALRFSRRLLGTQIPANTHARLDELGAPPAPARKLMDALVERVLTPGLPDKPAPAMAGWLLYVRSHWLRMPPWLLAQHLSRKLWRRVADGLAEPVR